MIFETNYNWCKNALRLHHNFYDPSKVIGTEEEKHKAFLKAREEIKVYFKNFIQEYLSDALTA